MITWGLTKALSNLIYRAAMNDKKQQYLKEWRDKNRELIKAKARAKYAENREFYREKNRLWRDRYKMSGPTVVRTEKCCSRCGEIKPIEQFNKDSGAPDGHGTRCKPCAVILKDEWRKANPEDARRLGREQATRAKNLPKEERLKYARKYYATHKELSHQRSRKWQLENPEKYRAIRRASFRKRVAEDPNFAFAVKFRSRVRLLLSGKRKSSPTEQLLGCSIKEFQSHLERLWEPWMNWANYGSGKGKWCIDHVVPVSAFDLHDPDQQKLCFHYTNLRPLCCEQNRIKWHRYEPESMKQLRERVFP